MIPGTGDPSGKMIDTIDYYETLEIKQLGSVLMKSE